MKITQHYWNRYKVQPVSPAHHPRPIAREEPRTWDTPRAIKEREQLRKMVKAMDGVGWTVLILVVLLALVIIVVQLGIRYGW